MKSIGWALQGLVPYGFLAMAFSPFTREVPTFKVILVRQKVMGCEAGPQSKRI